MRRQVVTRLVVSMVMLASAASGCSRGFTSRVMQRWGSSESVESAASALNVAGRPEVWFTPNIGSPDLLNLFSEPELWPQARARLDTFCFYAQQIQFDKASDCQVCGPNIFPSLVRVDAFAKLKSWNIATALEIGVIKPSWGTCKGAAALEPSLQAIRKIHANNGTVTRLIMDEPFYGGVNGVESPGCRMGLENAAREVGTWAGGVLREFPEIEIGDIEPYPALNREQLVGWIATLKNLGVPIKFVHLDIDIDAPQFSVGAFASDLQAIRAAANAHGLLFGVVYWPGSKDVASNREYFTRAVHMLETVKHVVGTAEHHIFQSWASSSYDHSKRELPVNLPENDASIFSHTQLILQGTNMLGLGLGGTSDQASAAGSPALQTQDGMAPSGFAGLFRVGQGVYNSTGSTFCAFGSWEDFAYMANLPSSDQLVAFSETPLGQQDHGACPLIARAGLFRIGDGIYFSSGSAFCAFTSWDHFVAVTQLPEVDSVSGLHRLPDMADHGACPTPAGVPNGSMSSTETTPSAPAALPAQAPLSVPPGYTGFFRLGQGVYNSNGSAFCAFGSWEDYVYLTGLTNSDQWPAFPQAPGGQQDHGACPLVARTGLFRVGEGVYYSSGNAFCAFTSWDHFVRVTKLSSVAGISVLHRMPDMTNDGGCP